MASPLDSMSQADIDDLPSLADIRNSPIWDTLSSDIKAKVAQGMRQHVAPAQSWYKAKSTQSPDAAADLHNARSAAVMGRPQEAFASDAPNLSTPVSTNPLANFAAGVYNKTGMGAISQGMNQGQPVFGATEPEGFGGQVAQQGLAMAADTPAYIVAGAAAPALPLAGPVTRAAVGGATAMGLMGAGKSFIQSGDPIEAAKEGLTQAAIGGATMGIGAKVGGLSRFAGNTMAAGAKRFLATTGAEGAAMTGGNYAANQSLPTDADGNTNYGQIGKDLASNLILTGGMKLGQRGHAAGGGLEAAAADEVAANRDALASEANPSDFAKQQALVGQIGQRIQAEIAKGPAADPNELHDLKNQYQMAADHLQSLQGAPNDAAQKGFAATQGAEAGPGFITYPTEQAPVSPGRPAPAIEADALPQAPKQIEGPPQRLMLPAPGERPVAALSPGQDHGFTTEDMQQGGATAPVKPSLRAPNPYGDNIRDQAANGPRQIEGPPQPAGLLTEGRKPFGPDDQARLDELTQSIAKTHDQMDDPRLDNKPQRAFNLSQKLKAMVDEATALRGRRAEDAANPVRPPDAMNAADAQGVEQSLRSGRQPARAATEGIWSRLLNETEGSSNFTGMLEDLANRWHREEDTLSPDMLSKLRPTSQRNGNDVYTIKGQEWEHAGTNANGREIMHRYDTPEQRAQSTGIGATINDAIQPLNNAGDKAQSVRTAANTGRMGEVMAGKFIEDLRKFDAASKARMHKVLDDPNNVGGHNIQLTGDEQVMVNKAKALMDEAGNEGVRSGVLKGKRDVYAPHFYEEFLSKIFNNKQPGKGDAMSTSTSHSKERTYDYLHQAEAAGLHPVYDISSVADVYQGLKRKIAAADLITDLKGSIAPDGRPMVQHVDSAPRDYVKVNNNAFRSEMVHPQVAAAVKAFAENNTTGAERAYMKAKQLTISYQLAYPAIHGMNVASKAIWKSGLGLPGDVMKGHGMWADEATVRDAVAHNLNLQGNSLGPIHEILDGAYGEQKAGILRQIDNTVTKGLVSKVMDTLHHALWSNVRALQLGTYERAWRTMVDQGHNVDEAKHAAAYLANNWMGMIPKEEMSDGLRRFSNVALFSRGWTLGNLKSFEVTARGAKALTPDIANTNSGKYVAQAMRMSVFADTATRVAMMSAANLIMSKIVLGKAQWPWENEPGKRDRVIIGRDADGTLRYSQLPVCKFTDDLLESLPFQSKISSGEVGKYWGNKGAPLVKSAGEAWFNSDSRGQNIYKDTDPQWKRTMLGADHILQGNLPGYDMVRYAMKDKDTGTSKLQDDAASFRDMPRQAQAAFLFSKALGASTSKGHQGGQEAAAMAYNRKIDDAQRADTISRFNKLSRNEATRPEAMALLMGAKDQNGDALFNKGEMHGMAKASAMDTPDKIAKYEGRHPGFAATQGAN